MFNRVIPFLTLMFLGVITTSCDKNELEEVSTESTAAVQNASANIFIEETFEGSNPLSTFHGVEFGTSHAFSVVTNPVFDGAKVGRIELRDTDPLESNGTRAEMVPIKDKMQKEMWFSFAVYLPAADFAIDSEKEIISQWHQSGGTSPPSFVQIQSDKWGYWVANKTDGHVKYDLGTVAKNKWNQFVFHYIQSNGSDGLVEVWLNGNKVVTHRGGNIYALDNLPKWKLGVYKWKWNGSETTDTNKRVLFYDNIRVGTAAATYAEMTAGGSTQTVETPTEETTETNPTDPTTETNPTDGTTAPVSGLFFVNAETEKDYKAVTNGAVLDIAAMGSPKVTVRADFGAAAVGSAKYVLTGAKNHTYIDNAKPYALFGDNGSGNFYYGGSYLPLGNYTLTVTPYSGANGTGTPGTPVTVSFSIVNGTAAGSTESTGSTESAGTSEPAIADQTLPTSTALTVVNAETEKDFKALTNGTIISQSAMGSQKVSVRADFAQAVGSAKYVLTGARSHTYTDNAKPYALFGDNGSGNYYYGSLLPVGNYTLTVTPYSGANGTGTAGTPVKVSFTITQ